MGAAVDLTPGTASTIFFQIRPFWPSYLDAFTLVKAWYLPKWSAFFYEGQIFIFSLQLLSSALETLLGLFRSLKEKKPPTSPISRLVASLLSYKTTLLAEHSNAQADRECSPGKATSATVAGNTAVSLSSA